MAINCTAAFGSEEEWSLWANEHNLAWSEVEASLSLMQREGIISDFFGHIAPEEITVGPNLREELVARGLNSRQRAVLELLASEELIGTRGPAKIFAPEAISALALELRGRFPFFVGSEYATSREHAESLYPLQIEDLQNLSFKSDTFDAVVSCDVFEHVPDLAACLQEMARVLKPGGVMISTHPFTWDSNSVTKAILKDSIVVHLQEPEYHGNPVDPKGSLVFTVPGWDILDQCRTSGFRVAEMVMIASARQGIFGGVGGGFFVNVLRGYK